MRKARIILDVENPNQQRQFEQWCQAAGIRLDQLDNEGCGCCVNIYLFLSTERNIRMLDDALQGCGTAVEYLPDDY